MVAKIVIPPNVPVNDLYASANMTASNALTTTNVFATSAVANGMMTILGANPTSRTSLLITGNVIVSNALVAGNVFTNTFVLSDTIRVTAAQGNIFASNALVTTNVYASDQVVSTGSTIASFSLIVGGNAYVSNALTTSNVSTSNLVVSGNVVIHSAVSTGFKTLDVVGNAYVSNAVTVSNVFTSNVNIAGTTTITSDRTTGHIALNVTGNVYVSNTLTTTNVYATGNVLASGSVVVTGNAYMANAVSTTNVFAGNVLATGLLTVTGLQTSGFTSLNVGGNVSVSNAISTTNVFTGNVLATGTLTVPALTTSGILTARIGGNVYVSNAITLVNDMFTGNTVATGTVTVTNTAGFASLVSRGNVSVSNAFTGASNVFVGNVFASGNIYVSGDSTVIRSTTLFVSGNVYASNAIVSVNVSANTWSSNLATIVNVTGNLYAGNNITTQNLFTTNVFSTRTQINNAGLSADPATGAFIVSTVSSSTQAQTYPPAAMTGYTLTIPGGGGTYTASASSEQGTQLAWKAFDGLSGFDNVDNIWKSNGNGYNGAATGLYVGGILTAGTYAGEWLQLQVPGRIILTGYTITAYLGTTGVYAHNPRKWFVFGSNDASTWTLLDSRSGVTSWTLNQGQTYSASGSTAFTYFRIVVNEIQSAAGILNVVIGELSLTGTMVSPLPIAVKNLPNYVESGVTSTVFPSAAMTSDSTVIGTGTYVASASSTYDNVTYQAYRAFDKNATTVWHQQLTPAYSTTDGNYIGTTATNFSTTVGGVPYYGEWLQLRLPTANVLSSYAITSRAGLGAQAPATFYIMGSNDDTTFTLIDTQTSVSWLVGGGETKTFTASSPYPFTRYRIVFNKITGSGSSGFTSIASWDLNCLSTLGFNIGDEYYDSRYLYKMMGTNPTWRSIARPVLATPVIGTLPLISTSGGTETTPTNFKVHAFTTTGASTLTVSGVPAYVDILVVGAGGSGGSRVRGGGGAGGVVYLPNFKLAPGQYAISVGTGGASRTSSPYTGNNGGNTTFTGPAITTVTAYGGGGGASTNPGAVATGGGNIHNSGRIQGTIIGQGYEGGDGALNLGNVYNDGPYSSGGGGGAGGPGNNGDLRQIANGAPGGPGVLNEITRTNVDVTSGLVFRVPFDGTIVDTIGAKTFTTSGTAVYSGGVNGGQCASFRPASGGTPIWYTSCPSPITQPPFTVSFWFKPTDVMNYYGTVFGMSPTTSPPSNTAWYNADICTYPRTDYNFTGSIGHNIAFPGQWTISAEAGANQINTTFTMNTWNHITVTATSAWVVKGYVNGALTSQATGTGNFPSNIARIYIGANADGSQNRGVNADLQDFRIYNRAITDREVASLGRLNHFGGGGGGDTSSLAGGFCGRGGLGGGGRGGGGGNASYRPTSTYGAPGTDGTGGGGGGGSYNGGTDYASGKGGDGAVYVRVRTNTDVVINSRCETARVIPVAQTLPIDAVGPIRWTISGAPTGVYLDSMQSTGCNIIIPPGTYTAGTYACTITAFNVNNNSSTASVNIIVQLETTGGSISYETAGYRTHYFLTPGVDTFNVIGQGTAEILIVGGGGGGGCGYQGGGGGGGGIVYSASKAVSTGSFSVCTGQAGLGSIQSAASFGRSTNGGESYVAGLGLAIAVGGGGGAGEPFLPSYLSPSPAALSGGSGGGGSWGTSSLAAGAGTAGQGFAGGTGFNGAYYTGAGGGGAGGVGANSTSTTGGNGGNGAAYSITGTSKTYSGGGGGSYRGSGTSNGTGGTGGGGSGLGNGNGQFATYYGGGGGAGGSIVGAANRGGNGHQGIVIIRVPIA